ncbi:MAG TPA: hypothetical protein P5509_07495 [Bacteroidales bacterium]|nr:hypothetical protein [Bacteroidales bacterium]
MKKYFKRIENLLYNQSSLLTGIILFIILSVFFYLNISNYSSGSISNGQQGIKYWLDTERYLEAADNILSGIPLQDREVQFSGYILILAFIKLLKLPLVSIVIIQIIVAIIAAFLMFRIIIQITESKIAALLSIFLFLCNPFITKWHLYILTESLYTSLILIYLITLYYAITNKNYYNYILTFILLLITISIRPNAWLLLPLSFVFIIIYSNWRKYTKITLSILIPISFILILAGISEINKSIMITTPIDNLENGITVWGHNELNLNMPKDSVINRTDWTAGFSYVLKHPLASTKLACMRIWYSIIHIRPFHSVEYKTHVLIWILPAYLLTIIALVKFWRRKLIKLGFWFIATHLIVIALSYAEHDSRFDIYILPIFYLISGISLGLLIQKSNNNIGN